MSQLPITSLMSSTYLKEYDINSLNFLTTPKKSYEFHLKEFAFIEELGSGRFGIVRKYQHLPSGQILAIKVNLESLRQKGSLNRIKEDFQKIKTQIDLHNKLSSPGHPNILNVYGHCFIENQFLICMEVMDISLKELYLKVHEEIFNFPENLLGYITCAVVNGLIYCKNKDIIHRDIKPANILLNWTGEIKLCDFGESSFLEDSLATTYKGTIAYWPPERFNGLHTYNMEKYDVRADIWSLGISMMEIIRGSLPYHEENDCTTDSYVKLQHRIMHIDFDDMMAKTFHGRETYGVWFKKFIQLCLQDYENRPKYGELIKTELYLKYFFCSSNNVRNELYKALPIQYSPIQYNTVSSSRTYYNSISFISLTETELNPRTFSLNQEASEIEESAQNNDSTKYEYLLCLPLLACVRVMAIVNLITNVILLSSFGGYILIICSSKVLLCCIIVVLDLFFKKDTKIWFLYLVFAGIKFFHGLTLLIVTAILVFTNAGKFAYDHFPNKDFNVIRCFFVLIQVIINVILWFSVLRLFIFKTRTNKQEIRKFENGTKI